MAAMTIAPVGMGVRALDGARATTSGVRRGGAAFTSRALGANAEGWGSAPPCEGVGLSTPLEPRAGAPGRWSRAR